jgi:hypothetical protein
MPEWFWQCFWSLTILTVFTSMINKPYETDYGPARELLKKFKSLEALGVGKSFGEITKTLGWPTRWHLVDAHIVNTEWEVPGFYIQLIFKDDICIGVTDINLSLEQ